MQKEYVILKSPVKIGDYDRVTSYAQGLTKGEEQLLITRDCKFYLTDGKGGYLEFKTINSGVTLNEVTIKINELNSKLSGDVATLESTITSLKLEFDKYVTEVDFKALSDNVKVLSKDASDTNAKINQIETNLENAINDANHINRNTLDKFSEDTSGNPLFDGKKIVADFDTSGLEAEIADLNARSIIGSSLDYGLFRMTDDVTTSIVNTIVPFSSKVNGNIDIVNNKIQLKANKKYILTGVLRNILVSNTSGYFNFAFYNETSKAFTGFAGSSTCNNVIGQQMAKTYIETTSDLEISLRISALTTSALTHWGHSYIEVQEVGRSTIVDPAEDAKKIQFEYGMFKLNTVQAALAVNGFIKFNTMPTGNMSINASTYQIPLKANKKYNISINISGVFHNTVFALYNITTGARVQILYGDVNDTDYNYLSTANFIYTPTEDCNIGLKCYAIYGVFTSIDHLNTQITIQEIAQPYYFNYYKDSISSTVLFDGSANTIGNFVLLDNITKYDYLIVYSSVTANKIERASTIIKVSDIIFTSTQYYSIGSFYDTTFNYSVLFSFNSNNSLHVNTVRTGSSSWNNPQIHKIEGIGYMYENPYQDVITSIDEYMITDTQVDSDITSIWSGVGL